jgi:hypothetical protein
MRKSEDVKYCGFGRVEKVKKRLQPGFYNAVRSENRLIWECHRRFRRWASLPNINNKDTRVEDERRTYRTRP